jgi:hypothetical protein
MPTELERRKVLETLDRCDPDAWKGVMRYMAHELATTDQKLLAEIVCREAERRAKTVAPGNNRPPSDYLASVLTDVGMRITVTSDGL